MVDVIGGAHAIGQAVEVVDRSQDIVHNDVLGNQLIHILPDGIQQLLALVLFHQLAQHGEAHPLIDAQLFLVAIHKVVEPHHVVGEGLDLFALHIQIGHRNALLLDEGGLLPGEHLAGSGQYFAGEGIGDRAGQFLAAEALGNSHLLVELIPAHGGQIIALGIKEQVVEQSLRAVHCGGLTGTETLVDLNEGVLGGLDGGVLVQRSDDPLVLAEHLFDLGVGADADSPDQGGDGQLAVFVDAHIEHIVHIGLILQPGAPVGDDGTGVHLLVGPLVVDAEIHTRRTDDLRDHHPFGAVDDKGASVGHHREIAHEDFLLLDLTGLLVPQAHAHFDGGGIGGIPLFAFFHRILGLFFHGIIQEGQLQVAGVVGDGAHIPEHLPQAGIQEPLIGLLLHLDEVGHLEHFPGPRKANPLLFAALDPAVLFPVVHLPHSVSCQFAIH